MIGNGARPYLTRFEKSQPLHTQYQDTLFTIQQELYTLNNSGSYWCWKLPRLLLQWLVAEACQTSTSVLVTFKWLHILLTSKQPAVIHHTTGWWVWPWIWLLCVIWWGENGTNGWHLAAFNIDVAFACHFVATHPPTPYPLTYGSASGIG